MSAPSTPPPGSSVILFDGGCALCHGFVRFVLRRDRRARFYFAPLLSAAAARLLAPHGLDPKQVQTVILIEGDRYWTRSSAALRVLRRLGRLWALLTVFAIVPRALRDRIYDLVAQRRHRWFGPADVTVPPEAKERVLE